jgi:DNA repair protein RecO (recombination protein O)
MIEKATGLVLRNRPLTETSLIVHWLTRDLGRVATVAKGARRPKSPFRGKLDLFYLADFSFVRSRRSELHTLQEVNLVETHSVLRQDISCLQQACYCAALVEQATEPEEPMLGVHDLMVGLVRELVESPATEANTKHQTPNTKEAPSSRLQMPSAAETVQGRAREPETPLQSGQVRGQRSEVGVRLSEVRILAFELKLLGELGLKPDLEKSRLSPGSRQVVRALTERDWPVLGRIKPSEPQALELRQFLHGFLIFHLGRIPKGRSGALG